MGFGDGVGDAVLVGGRWCLGVADGDGAGVPVLVGDRWCLGVADGDGAGVGEGRAEGGGVPPIGGGLFPPELETGLLATEGAGDGAGGVTCHQGGGVPFDTGGCVGAGGVSFDVTGVRIGVLLNAGGGGGAGGGR